MLIEKYFWMELSTDGLLKPVKTSWGESLFHPYGYDTEGEAIGDFIDHFGGYMSTDYVLQKRYGISLE